MTQANICIRMDKDIKEQFNKLCEELGMTMSTAVVLFAKAVIREKGIPFALSINEYNEETRRTIDDVEKGVNLSKAYTSVDEMMKDVLKDD